MGGKHLLAIRDYCGAVVPGLGNRNGHRERAARAGVTEKKASGGKRPRIAKANGDLQQRWVHADAIPARNAFLVNAQATAAGVQPSSSA